MLNKERFKWRTEARGWAEKKNERSSTVFEAPLAKSIADALVALREEAALTVLMDGRDWKRKVKGGD